jgi:hypothetical protein
MTLDRELDTLWRELPRLLADSASRGKFALVYRDAVDSVWPDLEAGLAAGYERFGLEPFMVKEIVEQEEPQYFSRNLFKRCPDYRGI